MLLRIAVALAWAPLHRRSNFYIFLKKTFFYFYKTSDERITKFEKARNLMNMSICRTKYLSDNSITSVHNVAKLELNQPASHFVRLFVPTVWANSTYVRTCIHNRYVRMYGCENYSLLLSVSIFGKSWILLINRLIEVLLVYLSNV